jgi:hypothetical protein
VDWAQLLGLGRAASRHSRSTGRGDRSISRLGPFLREIRTVRCEFRDRDRGNNRRRRHRAARTGPAGQPAPPVSVANVCLAGERRSRSARRRPRPAIAPPGGGDTGQRWLSRRGVLRRPLGTAGLPLGWWAASRAALGRIISCTGSGVFACLELASRQRRSSIRVHRADSTWWTRGSAMSASSRSVDLTHEQVVSARSNASPHAPADPVGARLRVTAGDEAEDAKTADSGHADR